MGDQAEENSVEPEEIEETHAKQLEETLGDLKRTKATAKTMFTKVRRNLLTIIKREDIDRENIKDACEELDKALENAMDIMNRLFTRYKMDKDNKSAEKLGGEIEQMEIEYSDAQNRAQEAIDLPRGYEKFLKKIQSKETVQPLHQLESEQPSLSYRKEMFPDQHLKKGHQESGNNNSISYSQGASSSELIGLDLWKQLKRVTIPVFSGDKKIIKIGRQCLLPVWIKLLLRPSISCYN